MTENVNAGGADRPRVVDRTACCFSRGRVLLLTVTDACNQRCLHCMRNARISKADALDLGLLRPALAEALSEHRFERVVISGGEPTLVSNLGELIAAIAGLGADVSLCTNATRVGEEGAAAYAASGLGKVTVGLDGLGADHDWFRGSHRGFARALAGMRAFSHAGVAVTANICLHDRILDSAEEIVRALKGIELASISVTSPMTSGRLHDNNGLAQSVTREAVEEFAEIVAAKAPYPVSLRIPRCNMASCPSGQEVFAMDRHGNLGGCPDVGSVNVTDLAADPLHALLSTT